VHRSDFILSAVFNEQVIISADTQQVSSSLPDGDVVILSLKNGVYFGLNPVGARVWALIQKPILVKDLIALLLDEYQVDRQQCGRDLDSLLHDLAGNGLLQVQPINEVAA
jgi:hypothetical protein